MTLKTSECGPLTELGLRCDRGKTLSNPSDQMPKAASLTLLQTQSDLAKSLNRLVAQDKGLAPILHATGIPPLRRRESGYRGMAEIVCAQQVSTASAMAIWKRLDAAFQPLDPQAVLRARNDRLARVGLSRAKIKTLKEMARALAAGEVDLDLLGKEAFETAHNQLTALHGIGPWTADIYLLFCIGHGDAWPAGDLAIQEAVKLGLGLADRPSTKELIALSEPWRPYRGAAAHLWWAYYRLGKNRSGMPFASDTKTA
jgi:DNA-3-methyladenine glycosylase II